MSGKVIDIAAARQFNNSGVVYVQSMVFFGNTVKMHSNGTAFGVGAEYNSDGDYFVRNVQVYQSLDGWKTLS